VGVEEHHDYLNPKFTEEEIKNSKRIFKSATPKYTIDWYLKWVSSFFILTAITVRSSNVPDLQWLDLTLSLIGIFGWTVVSFLWKDRALILLNGVSGVILLSGLINHFFG
tara:strand:+ start:508 stop:837 length:330 start_codon:yes stop_codon:yes gene_type:complete